MNKLVDNDKLSCPISTGLKAVSAKWTVEILRECGIAPTRTRQFMRRIPGLSMKCLQERLKDLETLRMLQRTKYEEKVPRVEYTLTQRGRRLLKLLVELKALIEELSTSCCDCPLESIAFGSYDAGAFCPLRPDDRKEINAV